MAVWLCRVVAGFALAHIVTLGSDAASPKVSRVNTSFGYVVVDDLDREAAIIEGQAAQQAATEVLRIRHARFAIIESEYATVGWGGISEEGYPTYKWVFKNGGSNMPHPPDYVLRHEIGHDLFVRYMVPNTNAGQYGSDAPDWLDEMAAIAFEGAAQQASRRREAAAYAARGDLIPLSRLLVMIHPELRAGAQSSTIATFRIAEAASDDTPRFYATIRAFNDFLVDRTESPSVVAQLAQAFRQGKSLKSWIIAKSKIDGQHRDIDGVNAEFMRWLHNTQLYKVS
jgi:hypothetical protein